MLDTYKQMCKVGISLIAIIAFFETVAMNVPEIGIKKTLGLC